MSIQIKLHKLNKNYNKFIHHTLKKIFFHCKIQFKLDSSVFRFLLLWLNIVPALDFSGSEYYEDDCCYNIHSSSDEKYFAPFVHGILSKIKEKSVLRQIDLSFPDFIDFV